MLLEGPRSSEHLIPGLRALLSDFGWKLQDTSAVGVVAGPGSFTGARAGLAAAKALCEAGRISLVAVSRLQVLAHKAGPITLPTHAFLDAGGGDLFHGAFAPGAPPLESLDSRDVALATASMKGRAVVCEDVVASALFDLNPVLLPALTAADLVGIVSTRFKEQQMDDVALSDVLYLRRSDLEIRSTRTQKA